VERDVDLFDAFYKKLFNILEVILYSLTYTIGLILNLIIGTHYHVSKANIALEILKRNIIDFAKLQPLRM
jgi:hypothetical protein